MHHSNRPARPLSSHRKSTRAILAGSIVAAVCALPTMVMAQAFTFTAGGDVYNQNFDSMGVSGTTFVTGWASNRVGGTGVAGDPLPLVASTGNSTTGGPYNVGVAGTNPNTDRALGTLASGSTFPAIGASFLNSTGSNIGTLTINGFHEQWKSGQNATQNEVITFEYSLDATSLANGTWTPFTSLNLNEILIATTTAVAVDGNAPANRAAISGVIPMSWSTGTSLWVRWRDFDNNNSDGMYAVDDLSFSITLAAAARNLTWNPPTSTWATTGSNWLDGAAAATFTNGDNVTFTDSGLTAGANVSVEAGGINPNNFNVQNTNGTYTFTGGVIGGTGALTKTGAGTMVLGTTYVGNVNVNEGTLSTLGNDRLADTATVTIGVGATVDLAGNNDTVGALALTAGNVATGAGTLTLGGDIAITADNGTSYIVGNVNVGTNGTRSISVPNGADSVEVQIDAKLTGGARFAITGAGTVVLNGDNSGLTGGVTIPNLGNVELGTNTALGTGTLFWNGGTTNIATEMLGGSAISTPVSFGGNPTIAGASSEWSGSFVFAFTGAQSRTLTVENLTLISGAVSGSDDTLTVAGTGALTLSGTNTLANLNVNAGTLFVNSVTTVSGTANVLGGGLLGGGGTITGAVTVTDGTLAPGRGGLDSPDSTVTLTTGNLTVGAAGFLSMQINDDATGEFDLITVNGTVNIDPSASLTLSSVTLDWGTMITILANDGTDAITGAFFGKEEGTVFSVQGGQEFLITYAGGDGGNDIVLTAVPEPGSAMLLLGGVALLGATRRRRKA